MNQDIFDWLLLLVRWLHITVAVTWIGTSIFFMWLDRSFEFNPNSQRPGHVGDLWMVHGGGFYHVEKLLMGPTKVPERLHWFKWESYWTWMSGMILIALVYYTGEGTMLLDSMVSSITFQEAIFISIFSVFGSWFFYDWLWERKFTKLNPLLGHFLTLAWFAGMSYYLCHRLSGRAAYIHIGAMLGTWMTANVFMRIIPRQIKMVEASKKGEPVNQDWGKNAKNRSTHNTYLTLPVIFIMISNHFPQTYGHDLNWVVLLLISAGGAAIREYFVVRIAKPKRAITAGLIGLAIITGVIIFTKSSEETHTHQAEDIHTQPKQESKIINPPTPITTDSTEKITLKGMIIFEGKAIQGKKLNLPAGCSSHKSGATFSNEVLVKNGKLQNVLIRVVKGLEGKTYPDVPQEEIFLDQINCQYSPRVVAARVGQKVTFINSDPIFHNVRSVTTLNQRFNVAMPKKDQRETKIFLKPEIFLQTKCSVHPWMTAYVAVMDHPFYDVSDEKGEFEIKDLPAGTYTIEAWHETLGLKTQELTISKDSHPDLKFNFKNEE
jgi:uncharacterized membrane protein/plastocyanin